MSAKRIFLFLLLLLISKNLLVNIVAECQHRHRLIHGSPTVTEVVLESPVVPIHMAFGNADTGGNHHQSTNETMSTAIKLASFPRVNKRSGRFNHPGTMEIFGPEDLANDWKPVVTDHQENRYKRHRHYHNYGQQDNFLEPETPREYDTMNNMMNNDYSGSNQQTNGRYVAINDGDQPDQQPQQQQQQQQQDFQSQMGAASSSVRARKVQLPMSKAPPIATSFTSISGGIPMLQSQPQQPNGLVMVDFLVSNCNPRTLASTSPTSTCRSYQRQALATTAAAAAATGQTAIQPLLVQQQSQQSYQQPQQLLTTGMQTQNIGPLDGMVPVPYAVPVVHNVLVPQPVEVIRNVPVAQIVPVLQRVFVDRPVYVDRASERPLRQLRMKARRLTIKSPPPPPPPPPLPPPPPPPSPGPMIAPEMIQDPAEMNHHSVANGPLKALVAKLKLLKSSFWLRKDKLCEFCGDE